LLPAADLDPWPALADRGAPGAGREERRTGEGARVKAATRPDGSVTAKAESDDLRDARDLADRRRRQRDAEQGAVP